MQPGSSQKAPNVQMDYLNTTILNANLENIRFLPASQITATKEFFAPDYKQPLSELAECVLHRHSQPHNEDFDSGIISQLPRIDPYNTLLQLQREALILLHQPSTNGLPASSVEVQHHAYGGDIGPPVALSQKRGASDCRSDSHQSEDRALKKAKSQQPFARAFTTVDQVQLAETSPIDINASPLEAVGVQEPVLSNKLSTSSHVIPAYIVPSENGPVLSLEDSLTAFMERLTSIDESDEGPAPFSMTELRYLGRILEELSRRGRWDEVQVDTIAALLTYLETSLNRLDVAEVVTQSRNEAGLTDGKYKDGVGQVLDQVMLSLEHVALSLTVFSGDSPPHHLLPEELLIISLDMFKSTLENFLVPALEFSTDDSGLSISTALFRTIATDESLRNRMLPLVTVTCDISEKLCKAVSAEFSDSVVVKLVYTALSLFFIDTSSETMLGHTEAESLKLAGSGLLRILYARYSSQRSWILEETLSLLVKLPRGKKILKGYRLIDGSKIHSSSALLLQLVQSSAEGPLTAGAPLDFLDIDQSAQKIEMQKLNDGIKAIHEGVKSSITYIFHFLLSRSTKGGKSSIEGDYRAALESLLADLLTVLGRPEWPCADLFLFLLSKAMARNLDDSQSDSASKNLAVEFLGLIAAKIKTVLHELAVDGTKDPESSTENELLVNFRDLSVRTKASQVIDLKASYRNVLEYLGSNEPNDSAAKAARNFWICQWATEICCAASNDQQPQACDENCWRLLMDETLWCWRLYNNQERQHKSKHPMVRKVAYHSATYLTARQQLFLSFDMLLSRILVALGGNAVSLRAKSLKALSLIVTGDCTVLAQQNVRKTIALRLQDQSPAVRDAAIDLVGKYMLQDDSIRTAYYDIVSDRISDTGINVRKRVLRLLRDIYEKADNPLMCKDIAQKLLLRVIDEETTVRDLAIKSVRDVCLGPFIQASDCTVVGNDGAVETSIIPGLATSARRRELLKHTKALVELVGSLTIPQDEAFRTVIQHLLKKEQGHVLFNLSESKQEFARRCVLIVDCLVDLIQTLQDDEAPKSAVASTVHTLQTFVQSEPRLIGAKHLSALSVYLHCSATSDDWRITLFVLRIYQDAIPLVQSVPSSNFEAVEKLIMALVAKCPLVLLPESVSVLCLVVSTLTLHSGRLCKFFHGCVDLLIADSKKLQTKAAVHEKKTRRLITIVGLICRHFPFEQAIEATPQETQLVELKAGMPPTIQEFVFDILVTLCQQERSKALQQTALQGLGNLFMSFPTLMNSPRGLDIMDSVFAGHDTELQKELLLVYTRFLLKIHAAPALSQGANVVRTLVAKVEDHLEAGIGGAIMQRYLNGILKCALVDNHDLQAAAVDVISQVTLQALVHPMLCMPTVVALETCENTSLSGRAFKIHRDLHKKHASLIYGRSMECVRTMYNYQISVQKAHVVVQGFKLDPATGNAMALLSAMYTLLGDKRQARNALLSSLVKVLDTDLEASQVEVDGRYSCFIAENLAYLEYKTMEEVYLVIYCLNRIIAGTGMTLLENLSEHMRDRGRTPNGDALTKSSSQPQPRKTKHSPVGKNAQEKKGRKVINNMRSSESCGQEHEAALSVTLLVEVSVQMEAVILLKSYLKRLYDVSESKCQQFQPMAHASHKEKPTPKLTGMLARLQWHWEMHEMDALCGQKQPTQGCTATPDLIWRQLERFRGLIEGEAALRPRDVIDESYRSTGSNGPSRKTDQLHKINVDEEEEAY
ncbi:sister chromatid cohesion C-terminus-domain-containing protein [Dissophora ornata]|nr:sister chromatid cohesion C-terminus-domain-containing protein [Dissophora ornata]